MTISHKGVVDSAGRGWPMTLCVSRSPSSNTTKNRVRQARSGPPREPQAMPLIPAIRPSESSSHIADTPNNTPPFSDIRYAFIGMALSITGYLR